MRTETPTWCSSSWTFSSWFSLAATCHTWVAMDPDTLLREMGGSGCTWGRHKRQASNSTQNTGVVGGTVCVRTECACLCGCHLHSCTELLSQLLLVYCPLPGCCVLLLSGAVQPHETVLTSLISAAAAAANSRTPCTQQAHQIWVRYYHSVVTGLSKATHTHHRGVTGSAGQHGRCTQHVC